MVDGSRDYIMPNQRTVPKLDPILTLEVTAGVDEHIPANGNVLPKVRIERGEQPEVRGIALFTKVFCDPLHFLWLLHPEGAAMFTMSADHTIRSVFSSLA